MKADADADTAIGAYLAALTAVDATRRVKQHVRTGALDDWLEDRYTPKRIHVFAAGKAAPHMLWGLVEATVPFHGMGVAPRMKSRPVVDTFHWHDGDHPVPGPASFAAGAAVLEWARSFPEGEPLLVLLSGGASSLMEAVEGHEEECIEAWQDELAAGLDIVELNAARTARSLLKGGKLADLLLRRTSRIRVWSLSDVPPGTEAAVLGSGPFHHPDIPHTVLADNEDLVAAAGQSLASEGWAVYRAPGRIGGPLEPAVEAFLAGAEGLPRDRPVALVGGGEPDLAVPRDAPPGGRASHAVLEAARRLPAGALFAAFGSDGIDGTTPDAGAWSLRDASGEAREALHAFAAHAYLDGRGRCVRTGPSRTNVNDLWLFLRPPA